MPPEPASGFLPFSLLLPLEGPLLRQAKPAALDGDLNIPEAKRQVSAAGPALCWPLLFPPCPAILGVGEGT